MTTPVDLSQPIVRDEVLAQLRQVLAARHRLVLCGPAGVGKSVLLDQLLGRGERRDPSGPVLRAFPVGSPPRYAVLAELFSTLDAALLESLPGPRRQALAALLRWDRAAAGDPDPVALQLALRDLLGRLATAGPVWLVVDSAERADEASLDTLAQLFKHLPPAAVRAVVASRQPGLSHRLGLPGDQEVGVPAWTMGEVAELLAPLRLAGKAVVRVHRASGGLPDLALRIGLTLPASPAGSAAGPEPEPVAGLPLPAAAPARDQLDLLPARARQTVLSAALALAPSAALLQRAGHRHAAEDLAVAAGLGLVRLGPGGEVTFTAEATVAALTGAASATTRHRAHRALASAEQDPVAAVRHRALACDGPDPRLATELDLAVGAAQQRGEPLLAAELALLAADHTPLPDQSALADRLVRAAEQASAAGRSDPVRLAARKALSLPISPTDRLQILLAVINSIGQSFDQAAEAFAAAAAETGADPALRAQLTLWMAWRALVGRGDAAAVLSLARQAAELAARARDRFTEMQAWTLVGRTQRRTGMAGWEESLGRAERLHPVPSREVSGSVQFARARNALFDDRLDQARERLAELLAVARRDGASKGQIEVLRSLAEVEVRAGRCATARRYRQECIARLADSDLSPAPVWYMSALVECDSGDPTRAAGYAEQGLAAARAEHDVIFTARNLYALGRVRLLAGDPAGAAGCLAEAGELEQRGGTADPSVLPWPGELVEALAGSGELAAAYQLLSDTRVRVARLGTGNVTPRLDLAEGACRLAEGDLAGAAALFDRAGAGFAGYGLRIEHGRAVLAGARVRRRLRRRAAARELLAEAGRTFAECQARPWLERVRRESERLDSRPDSRAAGPTGRLSRLSPSELRLVALVGDGASNRQAATSLGISVKTVEATLTRIYRKLAVTSRLQLAKLVDGAELRRG